MSQDLGERRERILIVGASVDRRIRIGERCGLRLRAAYEDGVEHVTRRPVPEAPCVPVLARGEWRRRGAQIKRQRRPDQRAVEAVPVVGAVDAQLGPEQTALPAALRAIDQPRNEGEQQADGFGASPLLILPGDYVATQGAGRNGYRRSGFGDGA